METRPQTVENLCGYCVHMLSGRTVAPKLCMLNYECHHCAFDQWLDNMDAVKVLESKPTYSEGALN